VVLFLENAMLRRCLSAVLWAALALITPTTNGSSFAGGSDPPEKTVPQGQDPPGAENGEQQSPPSENKEVIPPPPVGDEDIYTQVPNPEAGHEEEVIPPPAPDEAPSVTPFP
jgi:hypothetical protein